MSSEKGRGPNPRDPILFNEKALPKLSQATIDLCYLYQRKYAEGAALKLVGDHFQLQKRQRLAIMRSAADLTSLSMRNAKHVDDLRDQTLEIDGFNLIILMETALGGGLLMRGADGTLRDLGSVHGNYRTVGRTREGIEIVGKWLEDKGVAKVKWWLDKPVSNSGRLVTMIYELAEQHGWPWEAQTELRVDHTLSHSENVVVTTDKMIIEKCQHWTNLGLHIVTSTVPDAWMIYLPENIPSLPFATE